MPHGTRRGYQRCVAGEGGRPCDSCRQANTDYTNARNAARRGLLPPRPVTVLPTEPPASPPVVVEPQRPGPVELAVVEACAALSTTASHPDLVETALSLARILDDRRQITTQPSASRELRQVMAELRAGSAGRSGRLADVARLSRRAPGASTRTASWCVARIVITRGLMALSCGDGCRTLYFDRQRGFHVCPVCATRFESCSPKAIFCSKPCQQRHWRRRKLDAASVGCGDGP